MITETLVNGCFAVAFFIETTPAGYVRLPGSSFLFGLFVKVFL